MSSTSLSSSFDDAWARFQQLDVLHVDGDTPDESWSRGRAQFLAFLVRIEDRNAREAIARVCEQLAGIPGVAPYPDWYWHITVKGAGFQVIKRMNDDDVLRQDVARIAGSARAVLGGQPSYEVKLGRANAFPTVVFIEVHDAGRTGELNTALAEGIPQSPRYPYDGPMFLPHISIARFTSNDGLPALKERLASLRQRELAASFLVRRIEFVKAWLTEDVPEFDTLATYQLGS